MRKVETGDKIIYHDKSGMILGGIVQSINEDGTINLIAFFPGSSDGLKRGWLSFMSSKHSTDASELNSWDFALVNGKPQ